MALNIFPRREKTPDEPTTTTEAPLPEPSPEALAEAEADSTKRTTTRRGTRGGRGRSRSTSAAATATAEPENEAPAAEAAEDDEPKKSARRTRTSAAKDEKKPAPRAPRSRAKSADDAEAPAEEVSTAGDNGAARPSGRIPLPVPADPTLVALARAVEHQSRQIERVVQLQEQLAKRPAGGGGASTRMARVAVFVDVANVELAAERARVRLDWGKILDILTRDRELIRAVAYAPVHDDPSVSLETQRFAEPFLDKGYKIVTKPLKRFADGTVKANVDIELALDVITMLDRLDVVCLVSGDGDFQRLVEVVQGRGIRVEVVGYGSSTAGALRHAADYYIDLQTRLKDVRR